MRRHDISILALAVLLAASSLEAQQARQSQQTDWNQRAPWGALRSTGQRGDWEAQRREPFKLFDNVYYVGLQTVSCYLITTNDGLALLDATYAETAEFVLDSVRKLGFNPADIKYIFISHGHGDHHAGAAKLKQATGARVGMSLEDWQFIEERKQNQGLPRDLIVRDGETITLGETTFKFYVSPGHTPGSLSVEYPVRDRGRSYRALSPGGLGFNFSPDWTARYIDSIERLKKMGPYEVLLPNHPYMAPRDLFDVAPELDTPRAANVHPAAPGSTRIEQWFDSVLKVAREKLASEQKR